MTPARPTVVLLAGAASVALGILLPLLMAPASKSSPLLLSIAAVLAMAALVAAGEAERLLARARTTLASPAGLAAVALVAWAAISILWSHDRAASARQFGEALIPLLASAALALAFPPTADRRRLLPWLIAAGATALIVVADIKLGLPLRRLVGGRETDYSYNRAIVTLAVLALPLLALAASQRKAWLGLLLLPLPVAVFTGESGTAVLGFGIAVLVLPIAWLLPRFARIAGLATVLAAIAIAPVAGTLAGRVLGAGFHERLASAHSSDRVDIWRSFELTAQRRPIAGNGFGAGLNLQRAPVAAEIPPERVTLLGTSHPHNAFLQLWVELGAVGAALAAFLAWRLFGWIGRADRRLQPFLLAWIAVVAGIALVSHGAWQPWWIAAIGASAAGFLAVARELGGAEPL